MKDRTLIILAFIAIVLGGIAVFTEIKTRKQTPATSAMGKYLMPELRKEKTLSRIARIVVRTPSHSIVASAGPTEWRMDSKYGYPADFKAIQKFVARLIDLKIADVVPEDDESMKKLDLVAPGTNSPSPDAGSLLSLQDSQGNPLASIILGKKHLKKFGESASPWQGYNGYADGRFLAVDGKGYMVADALHDLPESDMDWIDSSLVEVSASDIKAITITGSDNKSLKLIRDKERKGLVLNDIKPDEEMDTAKTSSIGNMLSYLHFNDIADPSMAEATLGFDKALTYVAETRDGRIYTVSIGGKQKGADNRFIRIKAQYSPPQEPEEGADNTEKVMAADQARMGQEIAALNKRTDTWTYAISSWKVEDMTTDRSKLVKQKEKDDDKKDQSSK